MFPPKSPYSVFIFILNLPSFFALYKLIPPTFQLTPLALGIRNTLLIICGNFTIWGRTEGVITCLQPGHYLENSLICFFQSALLTVWFAAHFILCHGMISAQTQFVHKFYQGDGYLWSHCCMNNLYFSNRSLYAPTSRPTCSFFNFREKNICMNMNYKYRLKYMYFWYNLQLFILTLKSS